MLTLMDTYALIHYHNARMERAYKTDDKAKDGTSSGDGPKTNPTDQYGYTKLSQWKSLVRSASGGSAMAG